MIYLVPTYSLLIQAKVSSSQVINNFLNSPIWIICTSFHPRTVLNRTIKSVVCTPILYIWNIGPNWTRIRPFLGLDQKLHNRRRGTQFCIHDEFVTFGTRHESFSSELTQEGLGQIQKLWYKWSTYYPKYSTRVWKHPLH